MAYQYQPYTKSNEVKNYQDRQDRATNAYNNYATIGYSSGAGGLDKEVKTAQDRLNALYQNNNLSQQFNYSKQGDYDKALNAISNRKAFEYDLSNDMLFQQAKEQYQQMGKTAMADTIGQASAMTGGYGNSYATTAGAQAYNAYLRELNNSIGDYYSMALSTYNNETDRLNGIYNAYATDRGTEANEWTNNWNVYNSLYNQYYNQYSDMLNKDMTAWQQKGSNLYNAANLATSQYGTASSNDINVWNSKEQLRAEQAQQIEAERANRAEEAYRNAALAETIRANKANEAYNRSKKEQEEKGWYDSEATPTRDNTTSKYIQNIDSDIISVQYSEYGGDYSKALNTVLKKYIDDALENKKLTSGQINYLLDYYGNASI